LNGITPSLSSVVRDYQEAGASWMSRTLGSGSTRAVMLADDPGLGKSLQALLAIDRMNARRVCIVSPAGARRVWWTQIHTWFPVWASRIVIIEPGNMPASSALEAPDVIVLVSYDILSQHSSTWKAHLMRLAWDVLVIDEAHYLKAKSNRTAALYGLQGGDAGIQNSASSVILMTGTPSPNHAGELYQHLRTFWPQVLRSLEYPDRPMPEEAFIERVCEWRDDPKLGRVITGSKNVGWLRQRMRPYVLYRSKRQVLHELKPVIEQDVPLSVSPETTLRDLDDEQRALHRELMHANEARLLRAMQQSAPLATLRRRLGELKIAGAAEWIIERLECGTRKMLVFGWHPRVLELLHTRMMEFYPVIVTGATPPDVRFKRVEFFQSHPACRLFIGQIRAAGTALTLTAASEVVMLEPSWVPGENRQAIDRAHRLGQHDSVLATYLYLPGTLDARILNVMRRKQSEVAELLQEEV